MHAHLDSGMALRSLTRGGQLFAASRANSHHRCVSGTSLALRAATCASSAHTPLPPPQSSSAIFHTSPPPFASRHCACRSTRFSGSSSQAQQLHTSVLVRSSVAEASTSQTASQDGAQDPATAAVSDASQEASDTQELPIGSDRDSERLSSNAQASTSGHTVLDFDVDEDMEAQEGGKVEKPQVQVAGAFQRLSMVQVAKEHLSSAQRSAMRVGVNKKLKNEARQASNKAARQMDTLMKELTVPLGKYGKSFPPPARLHPFERALLALTVGEQRYVDSLQRVDNLRKTLLEVGKSYAGRAAKASSRKDALALAEEGGIALAASYTKGAPAVDGLCTIARQLRRLPAVEPYLPTVALVGAPNVGKSSLVQCLSSGLPEICDYPFTTRSIKMGHFYVNGRRHQVTDTPGLLDRPEGERNAMERLTLAALEHLPTAVLFVVDLTGECGTSVRDQWRIRANLKHMFRGKLWLDVLSKADLLEEEFDAADELTAARQALTASVSVSAPSSDTDAGLEQNPESQGVDDIAGRLAGGAGSAGAPSWSGWQAAGRSGDGAGRYGTEEDITTAVELAAALPHAIRVSSMTNVGLDTLKDSVMTLLSDGAFAESVASGLGPAALLNMIAQAAGEQTARSNAQSARNAFEQPQLHAIDRGVLNRPPSSR